MEPSEPAHSNDPIQIEFDRFESSASEDAVRWKWLIQACLPHPDTETRREMPAERNSAVIETSFSGDLGELQRSLAECHDATVRRTSVLEALDLVPGERVLDIGCGGGLDSK